MQINNTVTAGSPLDIFTGTLAFLLETVAGYKDDPIERAMGITGGLLSEDDDALETALSELGQLLIQAQGAHNMLRAFREATDTQTIDDSDTPQNTEEATFIDETAGETNERTAFLDNLLRSILKLPDPDIPQVEPGPVLFGEGPGHATPESLADFLARYGAGEPTEPSTEDRLRSSLASMLGVDPANIKLVKLN